MEGVVLKARVRQSNQSLHNSLWVETEQFKLSENNFHYDLLLLRQYMDLKVIFKLKLLPTSTLAGNFSLALLSAEPSNYG